MSTILVIEDELEILEVTSVLLASSGYQVVHARNAEEGFRVALSRDDIDVVFTDVNLGNGMNRSPPGATSRTMSATRPRSR